MHHYIIITVFSLILGTLSTVSGGWIANLMNFERPVYTTDRMDVRDANKKSVKDQLHAQSLDLPLVLQEFHLRVQLEELSLSLNRPLLIWYTLQFPQLYGPQELILPPSPFQHKLF